MVLETKNISNVFFLQTARVLVLSMSDKMRAGALHKKTILSFSTIKRMLNFLISEGIASQVIVMKHGNPKKYYCLTQKGVEIRKLFIELDDILMAEVKQDDKMRKSGKSRC